MLPKGLDTAIAEVSAELERVSGLPAANAVNPHNGTVTAARARERLHVGLLHLESARNALAMLPLPVVEPETPKAKKGKK